MRLPATPTLILIALVPLCSILGFFAAQIALAQTVHFHMAAPLPDEIKPPTGFLVAATVASTDPRAHAILVETHDPYDPSNTVQMLITYDASTSIQKTPGINIPVPMTDGAAAGFTVGQPLFIIIDRAEGTLHARQIGYPRLHHLLSSNS